MVPWTSWLIQEDVLLISRGAGHLKLHIISTGFSIDSLQRSRLNNTYMTDPAKEFCGKCEVEIDRDRVVNFTLKNGKRVCELCFVRETPRPSPIRTGFDRERWKKRTG
jgi:hypothetical protein